MTIRTLTLNARNTLYYDTATGAWDIDQPPEPDTPARPRRTILTELASRGIVATPKAYATIDRLPETHGFRPDTAKD